MHKTIKIIKDLHYNLKFKLKSKTYKSIQIV
jgi:hypothetical protein